MRERRGDGEFPVKLHSTSARRSDLGKAAGWGWGERRGNPAAFQGMSEPRNKSREKGRTGLWRCGGERGRARKESIGNPARRARISHPSSLGRPWTYYQSRPPAALPRRSESGGEEDRGCGGSHGARSPSLLALAEGFSPPGPPSSLDGVGEKCPTSVPASPEKER